MDRTREAVRDLLRERHRLASNTPDDFILRDLAAAQRVQSRSAFLLTLMLAGAAAVSLLVGGVGIMNLMLVSVSERRQEIGLRMAIGARRREIGLQFLIEAGLLALLGCGAGILLALGGGIAFGAGPAIWNPLTGMTILAAIAAATLITVISALYPARKAAQLADALAQDPESYSQDRSKRLIQAFRSRARARTFQVTESAEVQPSNSPREIGRAILNTERPSAYPMQRAQAAPRCTAKSKRTGRPCRAPAVRGWQVCRMHGARGGAPEGKSNGNYRYGARSKEIIEGS
jgi:hypothetical protein